MKTDDVTLARVLAGELLTLRPAEYFIIAGEKTIEFVRASRLAHLDVLLQMPVTGEPEDAFEEFCRTLSAHAAYFGQPVIALIDNSRAFTYFKRLENVTPAQLYDRLSSIPKEGLETLQTTVSIGKSRIFAWQGVDRTYLNAIKTAVEKTGIQVTEISTVATQLIIGGPMPDPKIAATNVYRMPSGGYLYSVFTADGDILANRLPESTAIGDETDVFRQLEDTYHASNTGQRSLFSAGAVDSSNTGAETRKLGQLFQLGPGQQGLLKALAHRTKGSTRARSLRVALNSARLLGMILLSATVLLLAAAGIAAAWSSSLAEPIEDFQHRYSTKLNLSRQLDALQAQEQQLRAKEGSPRQTAAAVSAFCQRSFGGLFLTDLTIRYSEEGQLLVEATGAARRESTVFDLREHLAESLAAHSVNVNSLKPQARAARGAADSLFSFGISVTPNE